MLIASLVLLQVVIFAGLIYALRRMITQNVISATKHLEDISIDYESKEQTLNKQLAEADKKSQDIVAKAENDAARLKELTANEIEAKKKSILKDAKEKADEIMQQAERSRKKLISELDERIKKEANNRACELVYASIPEEFKSFHEETPDPDKWIIVTNNIEGKNAHGEMSHVWLFPFVIKSEEGDGMVMFDDGDRKIINLTHWKYA